MKFVIGLLVAMMVVTSAGAEIVTEVVEYEHDGVVLEGYLAYDDAVSGDRPGVLVCHAWKGIKDYTRKRARMLAEMGYVAFAADIYGKGIRPTTNDEAAEQATKYRSDRPLMRARAQAGLDMLKASEFCDTERTAAIGYCFGGGVVLELARSGADVNGVVSFHGNLDTPNPSDANNIKGRVLVCHGAADPLVPHKQLLAFYNEMEGAGVDYEFVAYSGAVHAFTEPEAGDDPSTGVAYDEAADVRSWQTMQSFFDYIFESAK